MENTYDNADFIEMLLKHLFRSELVLKKAIDLKLTGADLITDGDYNLQVYRILADLAIEIGSAPIDRKLLDILIKHRVSPQLIIICNTLLDHIYAGQDLMPEYFANQLYPFLKHRRSSKIVQNAGVDLEKIIQEHNRLIIPMQMEDQSLPISELFVRPTEKLLKKSISTMISTGFPRLNTLCAGGLGVRDLGLIVGYSGQGKTTMACCMAKGAALEGNKVLLVSFEEDTEDISNRIYANLYNQDYSSLHNGSGYMMLEELWGKNDAEIKRDILTANLVVAGLKSLAPMTTKTLKEYIRRNAEETGYIPSLIIVDQLSFLEPNIIRKDDQQAWQREGQVIKDLAAFSHQEIIEGSNQYFGLWVLVQARGNVKAYFKREDIQGYKAIINPASLVLGIGRENEMSNNFQIFSMKSRHSGSFMLFI